MSALDKLASLLTFKPLDVGHELQAGDVLKLSDGTLDLVGGVNALLGDGDDCPAFDRRCIVGVASIFDLYFCDQCVEWKSAHCMAAHT